MNAVIGKTQVDVYEYDRSTGNIGDFLYSGTFMGFGTIGLGINGVKQGAIVLAQVDDDYAQCNVVDLRQVLFCIDK